MQALQFIKKYKTQHGYKLDELLDYFVMQSKQKCKLIIQSGDDPIELFNAEQEWADLFKLFSTSEHATTIISDTECNLKPLNSPPN
jgi:hypothetical protein